MMWRRSVSIAVAVFVLIVAVMFCVALYGYLTGGWDDHDVPQDSSSGTRR
jgi:hypothetical protein